jgi:sec-independent protein translocase protein TatB
MLGVGWTEMLVIGVVALIVIGPKELPALMQKIGRFAGTVRRMGADFQRELNKTTGLDEVKNLRNAITQPLKQTTDAIRKEFNTTTADGKVTPSGALKPADPKADSVVKEIHEAAGIAKSAEPVKGVAAATETAKAAEPVKAAAVAAIGPSSAAPPPTAPQLEPAKKPTRARKASAKKPVKRPEPASAAASPADKPKAPRKRRPTKKTS